MLRTTCFSSEVAGGSDKNTHMPPAGAASGPWWAAGSVEMCHRLCRSSAAAQGGVSRRYRLGAGSGDVPSRGGRVAIDATRGFPQNFCAASGQLHRRQASFTARAAALGLSIHELRRSGDLRLRSRHLGSICARAQLFPAA